jgi:hypothetical protein
MEISKSKTNDVYVQAEDGFALSDKKGCGRKVSGDASRSAPLQS